MDMNGHPFKVVKYATDVTDQVNDRVRRTETQKTIDADLGTITTSIGSVSELVTSSAGAATETSANV